MIAVIDYGMCNTGSILNMLKKVGAGAVATSQVSDIEKADKLILPGVGAFDKAMKSLDRAGIIPAMEKRVIEDRIPLLGICLGMQILARGSEEGTRAGLGWLEADVRKFNFPHNDNRLKIPHMGWNRIEIKKESNLLEGIDDNPRFYFVHSYHIVCDEPRDILAETHHGYYFTSAVQHENIMGTQFHPEKSHRFGLSVFKNFLERF